MAKAKFDMPATGTWEQRGGWVVRALSQEFDLTLEQASGLVGNLGFESIGFTAHHEIGQADGVGGYGWAQWTGPRRRSFFAWCQTHNLDPQSDEANYGYLCEELRGAQKQTIVALRKCNDLDSATWSVGQTFERPAGTTATVLPGYDNRLGFAQRALAGAQIIVDADQESSQPPAPTVDDAAHDAGVQAIQLGLRLTGDYDGQIDGKFGTRSRAALDAFRERMGP